MKHLDVALDVVTVLMSASLLAFVVFVWKRSSSVGLLLLLMLLSAYMIGRWHTTRSWQRALRQIRDRDER